MNIILSYNRSIRGLNPVFVLKNKDTFKAMLENAGYICRQMIFEDAVEINP